MMPAETVRVRRLSAPAIHADYDYECGKPLRK